MSAVTLAYDGFAPDAEGVRESLTSTGNGYFCTRGAAEWEDADDHHYPGTYCHGGYSRETTIMGGRPVLNEDLVNLPNWLVLKLRLEGDDAVTLGNVDVLEYRHEYDARLALVSRTLRFRDRAGRETTLHSRRFVSMAHMHQAGIEWTVTPQNWSGRLQVVSALDGRVTNLGVARYRALAGRHLDPVSPRTFGLEVIALEAKTRQSDMLVAEAARTRMFCAGELLAPERELHQMDDYIQQVLSVDVRAGEPVRAEKLVAFYTSRDRAISEPLGNAGRSVSRYPDFADALAHHEMAWEEMWRRSDIVVPGDAHVQRLVRLHVSHVAQVCSAHTVEHDAGVPARGLNGEAYRGHVFWDELFVFGFLNVRVPAVTRALLSYRYRRLGEARAAAAAHGLRGAMFPWQSGSDGSEETQAVHLNPLSGAWEPDLSRNQRHVNVAIFANVWNYYQATGDLDFLGAYGAEIMLEIMRFWASIARFDPERERYVIEGVMGPDEFHEKYPGACRVPGGIDDNAYTNVMVAWAARTASALLDVLPAGRRELLRRRLGVGDAELATWEAMSRRMYVPFHADGVISQFEGYDQLEELDWDAYRAKYANVQRLDRILRAEGDDPDRYQLTKQADTVMLFFLFSEEELGALFARLGYAYGPETARRTIDYYDRRTSHGSTLSLVVHAAVLADRDPDESWRRFLVALGSDVEDVQGGTTREGIHLGVMAGTLEVIQRRYAGVEIGGEVLRFAPCLPAALEGLTFAMRFRGTSIRVSLGQGELRVEADLDGSAEPIRVGVGEAVVELGPGARHTFALSARPARRAAPLARGTAR